MTARDGTASAMGAEKVERVEAPKPAFGTVNQLVNEALKRWADVTGANPNKRGFTIRLTVQEGGSQLEPFDQYTLAKHLEALNESRDLDPTGLTTLMMLRGLTEHHLKTTPFTAFDLLLSADRCKSQIDAMAALRDLVESPDYVDLMDGFVDQLREAAEHYGVPGGKKNKALNELLEDKYQLAYVRRDALLSIKKLEAHQFTHGDPDPSSLKYNRQVFEFWNVNSLLQTMMNQGVAGISLCLIRDPEQELASFFVFAIRNGETLMVLTDREEGPHPAYNRMSRRPDRNLENRAGKHWFPYQLLELKVTQDGRLYAEQREQMVPYNANAVPLKEIGQLHPEQFVWLVLMFDLIRDKHWKNNPKLKQLSYTGEMVVRPMALIDSGASIELANKYTPLIVPPLDLKAVSLEETKEQWSFKGGTGFNSWMEKRYGEQVPERFLNPVGQSAVKLLQASWENQNLPTTGDHRCGSLTLGNFETLSPVTFGTKEKLERDRAWAGRVNKMKYVQGLAQKEFAEKKEEALEWLRKAAKENMPALQAAAAKGELLIPRFSTWEDRRTSFEVGYYTTKTGNCVTQGVHRRVYKALRNKWGSGFYGEVGLNGGNEKKFENPRRGYEWKDPSKHWYSTGSVFCVNHPDVIATVHTGFKVTCPQGIAAVLGCKVEDLHFGWQNWFVDEPYSGNSILDRIEPSDWVLHNPWSTLSPGVLLSTCKSCFHQKRKELGLPEKRLVERKDTEED